MKRTLSIVLLALVGLVLVACNGTAADTTKPVISGTKNHTYEIGDPEPDWLDGVTATDDVDGTVTVTVDKSDLNLEAAGSYNIVYKAVDKAGNEATVSRVVTVVEKDTTPPVITGAKNITVDKDSAKPNWLQGVSVTDDTDSNPSLTVDDSDVKMDTLGTYDLVYKAVDASGNESEVTVTVTVVEPSDEESVVFGSDPYNATATTSVSGVGVALYYDAKEDDVDVLPDKVTFVVESAPEDATGVNAPELRFSSELNVHYMRAYTAGEYKIKLVVEGSDNRNVSPTNIHTINVSAISTNQADDKIKIRNMYPNNISANPDYRTSEGTQNEFLIVGKDFTLFKRHEPYAGTNFAGGFVGFADFEGGRALNDFTISFKYTSLNEAWKLLFTIFSGEEGAGNDAFGGDWLRLVTANNEIGILGDSEEGSQFQDNGEAKNVPLKNQPVYIKFVREFDGDDVELRLYTSSDGETYTLQTTVSHLNADKGVGKVGAKLTGFAIFSIDNDFILEDLEVLNTAFSLS